ncbi:MAG: hypothetical protein AAF127_03990 [Pseudomonadota bacterium]
MAGRLKPAAGAAAAMLAGVALQGCVAAVIPALAGGALARSATDGVDAKVTVSPEDAAPAPEMTAPAEDAPASLTEGSEPNAPLPTLSDSARGTLVVSTAPPPAPTASAALPADPRVSEFVLYAKNARVSDPALSGPALSGDAAEPTLSAMLRDPTALSAERRACSGTTPTVLIDLDPAGETLAAESTIAVPPGLPEGLAELRMAKIDIAWISGASAADAPDIRLALGATGLDPEGSDMLLLMRYPGDRKQTRREDLAASSCLIAIAGNEREDFDELYDYLVDREAALGLELLIGDGWFLLPSALSDRVAGPASAPPSGATAELDASSETTPDQPGDSTNE